MCKRIALIVTVLASLAGPSLAAAHPSPQALIRHAAGPGTVVWGCHPHNHGGVLCRYRSPMPGTEVEYANGERGPDGYWESWGAVEHGKVRLKDMITLKQKDGRKVRAGS